MSNQRAVNFSLVGLAAVLVLVLASLLDQLWVYLELPDQQFAGGVGYPGLIALVVGLVTAALLRKSERTNKFLLEVAAELREITWPTRQEVLDSTRVVIIAVFVLATILGAFDLVWAKIARIILHGDF